MSEYIDYNDAYRQIGRFLNDVYVHKRIHSSLGYLTPAEFEEQWGKERALALDLNQRIAKKVSNLRGSVHFLLSGVRQPQGGRSTHPLAEGLPSPATYHESWLLSPSRRPVKFAA